MTRHTVFLPRHLFFLLKIQTPVPSSEKKQEEGSGITSPSIWKFLLKLLESVGVVYGTRIQH